MQTIDIIGALPPTIVGYDNKKTNLNKHKHLTYRPIKPIQKIIIPVTNSYLRK